MHEARSVNHLCTCMYVYATHIVHYNAYYPNILYARVYINKYETIVRYMGPND